MQGVRWNGPGRIEISNQSHHSGIVFETDPKDYPVHGNIGEASFGNMSTEIEAEIPTGSFRFHRHAFRSGYCAWKPQCVNIGTPHHPLVFRAGGHAGRTSSGFGFLPSIFSGSPVTRPSGRFLLLMAYTTGSRLTASSTIRHYRKYTRNKCEELILHL